MGGVRITGLAAANALGEKLPMFVIGKAAKPRCFKDIMTLPCRYRSQAKPWMDSLLFEEWIKDLDMKFVREGRKMVMIVDNCPAHPHLEGFKSIDLVFLPSNTTAQSQSMYQGVIRSLKAHYRLRAVQKMILAVEMNKPLPKTSILDAMLMLESAWDQVSESTITNSFRKAGISNEAQDNAINDNDNPFADLETAIETLKDKRPNLVPEGVDLTMLLDIDAEVSTNGAKPTDSEILAEVCGTNNAVLNDNDQDDDDEDGAVPTRPNTEEINQAIEILTKLSLYCESGKDIQAAVQIRSTLAFRDLLINKKQQTITSFF